MRVLGLDTTTRAGSVAILDDDDLRLERVGDASRSHAERLPQDILDALSALGLRTGDIDLFAVASGPGMFTGLRIGIATIQGLAMVHGRRVAPVSALRALVEHAARDLEPGTRIAAWMDAHRRDVFGALYEVAGPTGPGVAPLVEIDGPSVAPPAATLERWSRAGILPSAICGDGAVLFESMIPHGIGVVPPPAALAPEIARLARADHAAGRSVAPAGVQPLYVRRPDAEVARDAVAHRSR
jgi:tRNA threonylcarbamoyladenosine biosynthesis protein TsaB